MIPAYLHNYYDWLIAKIMGDREYSEDVAHLLWYMFEREFTWVIDRDQNRAADGVALRDEYFDESGVSEAIQDDLAVRPCSFLEFLIGISSRFSSQFCDPDDQKVDLCFWELMENANLVEKLGKVGQNFDEKIDVILERKYDKDGTGGLFPLRKPAKNQRSVEIWYQLQAYLMEKTPTDENY